MCLYWINNKHDPDDAWIIRSGERLSLRALATADKSSKKHTRTSLDFDDDDDLALVLLNNSLVPTE